MRFNTLSKLFFLFLFLYPVWAGAATVKMPLHKIAPVGITDLKCSQAEFKIKLPIPERWKVKAAFIDFGYVNSSALLPQNSRLVLKLNSYPLAQIELNPLAPEGRARVRLPGELLEAGYNDLTFFATQHYTLDCEFPCAPELWTTLLLDEAVIELQYDLKPVPLELSSMSDFLFDPKIFPYAAVNIVSEYDSPESISVASIAASGIALRFDYRDVKFSISDRLIPGVDNVLIGTKEFVESVAGQENLTINGPYLQIMHLPVSGDESTAQAAEGEDSPERANPEEDDTYALIIVSGNNMEEIRMAATSMAALSFPFPNSDRMEVSDVLLPEARAYSGKSILRGGTVYPFKTLGFSNHSFRGFSPQSKSLSLRLPTDLLIEQNRFAELSLHLAYGAGMRSDSVLNILLNNEFVTAIHLDNPNGAVFSSYKISIPSYIFSKGNNVITFEPVLTPSVTGQCELIQVDNLFLSIFDDSTFKFPELPHWVALPNIELFFQDGFPFTRWPDGRETALYITSPDEDTVGAALNLVGVMSQKIGYPLLGTNILLENPRDWKGEIIVIGEIGTVPEDIKGKAPLSYGQTVKAPYPVIANMSLNDSVPIWDRVKNYMSGYTEQEPDDSTETAFIEQTAGLGNHQGAVMEFESPYQLGRSVLLVTASSGDNLLKLSRALLDTSVQGKSKGNLVLVDYLPDEYTVWSQNVGETYYTGKLSSTNKIKSFINSSRLSYFALLAVSLLVLTFVIFYSLKRMRSKRVDG